MSYPGKASLIPSWQVSERKSSEGNGAPFSTFPSPHATPSLPSCTLRANTPSRYPVCILLRKDKMFSFLLLCFRGELAQTASD